MKAYSGIIKMVCLLIIGPVVIWKFALGSTWSLYQEKQKTEVLSRNVPVNTPPSEQIFSTLSSDPLLSNGALLKLLADTLATNQVEVVSYTPELIDAEGDYKLYCGKLGLSGKYISLVKVVAAIESAKLPIKVASMTFGHESKKEDADKKVALHLLIEQIER